MVFPSDAGPILAFASFITIPMSFIEVAPVLAITSSTIFSISSLLSGFGRYSDQCAALVRDQAL